MVEFNVEEDGRFLTSLDDLGAFAKLDVLQALFTITAQRLTWQQFVDRHGWVPVIWEGENTYPGAIDLFTFAVTGPSGSVYKLVGSCVNDAIVVCAIAVPA